MQHVSLSPLCALFGAEVVGLDLRVSLDATGIEYVERAILDHHVLAFRGQSLERADQVRFSACFGEMELPVNREYRGEGFPEVHAVSNVGPDGRPTATLGNPGNYFWHTDGSYLEKPPSYSFLYGVEIPASGAVTCFASTVHAYETLPAALRERIQGLRLVHSWAQSRINSGSRPPTAEELAEARPVSHPLVRTHPVTGQRALYFGNHASHIEGLPGDESRDILDTLLEHTTRADVVYEHHWAPGDLVMMDNRTLLHKGSTDYAMATERRVLHRTVLSGTRPV